MKAQDKETIIEKAMALILKFLRHQISSGNKAPEKAE